EDPPQPVMLRETLQNRHLLQLDQLNFQKVLRMQAVDVLVRKRFAGRLSQVNSVQLPWNKVPVAQMDDAMGRLQRRDEYLSGYHPRQLPQDAGGGSRQVVDAAGQLWDVGVDGLLAGVPLLLKLLFELADAVAFGGGLGLLLRAADGHNEE